MKQDTVPAKSRHLKQLACQPSTAEIYTLDIYDTYGANHPSQVRVDFKHSADGGASWEVLPFKLDWWSTYKRNSILLNQYQIWPPRYIDSLFMLDGILTIEYRDESPETDMRLPFNLDMEALWQAYYDPQKKRWWFKRIKFLDYRKGDRSPIDDSRTAGKRYWDN